MSIAEVNSALPLWGQAPLRRSLRSALAPPKRGGRSPPHPLSALFTTFKNLFNSALVPFPLFQISKFNPIKSFKKICQELY